MSNHMYYQMMRDDKINYSCILFSTIELHSDYGVMHGSEQIQIVAYC